MGRGFDQARASDRNPGLCFAQSADQLHGARVSHERKEQYLDLAADDIVLDGWNLPFRADTEGHGVFSGNACYNLVGDPEAIRQCVEHRAALPISDQAKAKIIVARTERTTCSDDGLELLYPDIETHHAVVNRMKG